MAVCDICNEPGMGTVISSEDMRKAVFKNHFDPFKLGLVKGAAQMMAMVGLGTDAAYQDWKGRIVAQDTSDWNICATCMTALRPYLEGTPRAAGVPSATVSASPVTGALAAAAAERKYGREPARTVAPAVPIRTSQPSSKCFIATASCGSEHAEEVMRLREFRDTVLRRSASGRAFIRVYETVSPPLADVVARSNAARWFVRRAVVQPARRIADWALRDHLSPP